MVDLVLTDAPVEEFKNFLADEIDVHAISVGIAIEKTSKPLAIALKDGENTVGGLLGKTYHNWLVLESLFVKPEYRGKGFAVGMMKLAEREACARDCHHIRLVTNEREAPGFYEHMGFEPVYTFDDLPRGTKSFLYVKHLEC